MLLLQEQTENVGLKTEWVVNKAVKNPSATSQLILLYIMNRQV
jgi:hypothetical protein